MARETNDRRGPDEARPDGTKDLRDLTWPLLIVGGLLVVVLWNFTFVWIATSGQDVVVESYMTESR